MTTRPKCLIFPKQRWDLLGSKQDYHIPWLWLWGNIILQQTCQTWPHLHVYMCKSMKHTNAPTHTHIERTNSMCSCVCVDTIGIYMMLGLCNQSTSSFDHGCIILPSRHACCASRTSCLYTLLHSIMSRKEVCSMYITYFNVFSWNFCGRSMSACFFWMFGNLRPDWDVHILLPFLVKVKPCGN